MTVAVTGASGHVGTHLVRALLARGERVRVLVHRATRSLEGLAVEQVRGDVLEPASLKEAFDGCDVVYHLAAVISIDGDKGGLVPRINVDGAGHAAEAAREVGVRRLVHMSSIHAFEARPFDEPLDETRPKVSGGRHPAYDRSKAAGEARVRESIARGLDAVIVNPTGIIGPLDFGPSRMGRTFLEVLQGRLPALVPGGFDFVDVRDVVGGALGAAERGRTGENYLLGNRYCDIGEATRAFAALAGVPPPRFTCPLWLAKAAAPLLTGFGRITGQEPLITRESLAALSSTQEIVHAKAERELGYTTRPLSETFAAILQWLREEAPDDVVGRKGS